jgi:sugar phosphate isomerase/epimerase
MTRLSMNEMTTYRWTFDQDVQGYLSAGIDAMGVWRQKLSDFGEQRAIELVLQSPLEISSLLWAGGFTGSDGRSHRESVQDAIEALRVAAAMRAGCLIIYTGSRAGHTHNHARRLMRSALGELVPLAAELGVVLAIEPMHAGCAAEWTFLTSLEETLGLLNDFHSQHLKLVFDTYHLAQDDERIVERLPEIVSELALVQLGDAKGPPDGEQNRCRLGDGRLPLRQIITTLLDAGYAGFFDVELMGEEIEASDYHELLAQSQQAFSDLVGVKH